MLVECILNEHPKKFVFIYIFLRCPGTLLYAHERVEIEIIIPSFVFCIFGAMVYIYSVVRFRSNMPVSKIAFNAHP